jgi:DNA-binding HxlR family transcriptional regulator
VRGMRSMSLLGRVRRPMRDGKGGMAGTASNGVFGVHEGQRAALDWREVQVRLGPVRHRWDLAILCNLNEVVGCRPGNLLAAINVQAEPGRELSPQVLSGRLRELEQDEYIRHEDLSVIPLHRVYFLQPPGQALLDDLSRITGRWRPVRRAPSAAPGPSRMGQ